MEGRIKGNLDQTLQQAPFYTRDTPVNDEISRVENKGMNALCQAISAVTPLLQWPYHGLEGPMLRGNAIVR